MKAADRDDDGPATEDAGANPPPPDDELAGHFRRVGDEFAELFRSISRLLGAESRLFASTLLLVLSLAVLAGLLTAAAVVFVCAAVVLVLVRQGGLDPAVAVLLVVLVLLAVVAGIFRWIRGLSADLRFRHSRRMLAELARVRPPMEDRE